MRFHRLQRGLHRTALGALLAAGMLAACAVPASQPEPVAPPVAQAPRASPAHEQAPAPSKPSAPVVDATLPAPGASASPDIVSRSCKTSADCAVKNVGNCCGYYPACVNKDSPTNPEAVSAQCAKSGMASVCGFRKISSCACNAGQCQPTPGSGAVPVIR